MIKKIQIYTNRIQTDLSPYLTSMFQYYQKHGVTLNYDITPINVIGYKSVLTTVPLVGNVYTLQNIQLPINDHDVTMFVFDYVDWKAPWYWPWPLWDFGPAGKLPRDSTYIYGSKPLITIGYWPTDNTVGQRFLHEPMHALAKIFGCQDVMDTYTFDSTPDTVGGNFYQQWTIFKPYLNPMNVTITRNSDNGTETLGTLVATANGATFTCNTLELPWKDNQHDISCIPKGIYQASIQPFHISSEYELSLTAPRTGIFIHAGNYYKDSLGCILLGVKPSDINSDGQVDVTASALTLQAFKSFMHNQNFTLTIQ